MRTRQTDKITKKGVGVMDPDLIILEDANAAVITIDRKYRKADFNMKLKLKKERDRVFNAYAKARLMLLEEGIIASDRDVTEMKAIRLEIARARQTQSILIGVGRLVKFLTKLAI